MTKEESIKVLTQYIDYDAETPDYYEMEKACKVAIKALEQEPCGNAISRQAVIDTLTKTSGIRGDALKALYDLPSVTPQPKMGRWIWIPVSERLPETDEDVLITDGVAMYIGWIDATDHQWRADSEDNYFINDVIAWMPLPEPYKPTDSEKE